MIVPPELERKLAACWPPVHWHDVTVLVAVSGGCDSVALLRAMQAASRATTGRLVAAHFNHGLRLEADADEQFVTELCRSLGLGCVVGRDKVARREVNGIEAAAREARYGFLRTTALETGARYVATAHTAEDQAETILHRLLRGTGLSGLAGMQRTRSLGRDVTLIRPLLGIHRAELEQYLTDIRQPFRQDASNQDTRYTRNRLRHELLPLLAEQYNPQVAAALLRLGALAGEAQAIVARLASERAERAVRTTAPGMISLDCRLLSGEPRYLVREVLIHTWRSQGWPEQSMGYDEWEQLAELAQSPAGPRQMLPGRIRAHRLGDELVLARDGGQ